MGRPRIRSATGTRRIYLRCTADQLAAYRAAVRKGEGMNAFGLKALDREAARRAKIKER